MEEEKTEETLENPTEEAPVEKETPTEEQETSEKPETTSADLEELSSTELEEKNKRLKARLVKENEKLYSTLKDKEVERKKAEKESTTDVFDLAKTVSTLKDYGPSELDFIQMMSKVKNISPEEAAQTEEAKLYIAAKREKVAKEKQTPEPSTKQSISKKPIDKITLEDMDKMSLKEKEDYLTETGWMVEPKKFGHNK